MRRLLFALTLTLLAPTVLSTAGCKNEPTIPGTEIPDTKDNRAILQTLERYRTAIVQKDAATVLASAHPTYLDEAGTEDPSDDVVYEELGPMLRRRLAQVDSIRFTMDYTEIHVVGDRAVVHAWMDASFRMKPLLASDGQPRNQPDYVRKQDHVEFHLVREGESWLITSGL